MERPENESPEEIIINMGITYCLRNYRFSRELSEKFYNHLPTKKTS
jgi:hypothetical protein